MSIGILVEVLYNRGMADKLFWNITKLRNWDKNPRAIKSDKFQELKNRIKKYGQFKPVITTIDGEVIGGNMRLRAMKDLGMQDIWVSVVEPKTEAEKIEIALADNEEMGYYQEDQLAELISSYKDEIKLDSFSIHLGDGVNLLELLKAQEPKDIKEDDYEIPNQIVTDIKYGDVFKIGEHRLMCGDSTDKNDVEILMNGYKADMVLTDPPYNVDYKGDTNKKIKNDNMDSQKFYKFLFNFYTAFGDITKEGGAWYVWHTDNERINFTKAFQDSGMYFSQCLIWVKNSLVLGRLDYHKKHETCLYGWKLGKGHYFTNDRTNTTVIEDNIDYRKLNKLELIKVIKDLVAEKEPSTVLRADKPLSNDLHPTMKPILLLTPLIRNSSKPEEIVADGFIGSGSTMVACHQLNRKCYGMELDPNYCQVVIDRMKKLDSSLEIVKVSNESKEKQIK